MFQKFSIPAALAAGCLLIGIGLYAFSVKFIESEPPLPPSRSEGKMSAHPIEARPPTSGDSKVEKPSGKKDSVVDETVLPEWLADYVLIGTANRRGGAYAVIRNTETEIQRLYDKGDALEKAVIEEIAPGRVIVRENQKRYVIRQAGHPDEANAPRPAHDLPPRDFSRPDPERMERGWEAVRNLMVQIDLNAHEEDGRPNGVEVGAVQPDSVFEQAGLQPGDIIHTVNGRRIVIEDDAMEIYEVFRSGAPIRLEIVRGGTPMVLEHLP